MIYDEIKQWYELLKSMKFRQNQLDYLVN